MDAYQARVKAVSEPTRLRLLRVLVEAKTMLCLSELVDIIRRPQYAVSKAMAALEASGLVTEDRRGKLAFYGLVQDPFNARLYEMLRGIPQDDAPYTYDSDRLRWRLELRENGRCVVTYTAGYNPVAYKNTEEAAVEHQKPGVLFVCVHNSARSQMAEEYLRRFGGDLFEVESAGLTPGKLNPYVVELMREEGIDISDKQTQSVVDLYRTGRTYSYVVTVCSREAEKNCPIFPGPVRRLNWPFPDPSRLEGSREQILDKTREIRDQIRDHVTEFVETYRRSHKEQTYETA